MNTLSGPGQEIDEPSDAELIAQVRAGSRRAQEILYTRHHDAALGVAYRHSNSPHEAEDLAAEGFEKVFAVLATNKGPEEFFRAYLCTTVSRLAFAYNNKEKTQALTDDFTTFDTGDEYADPVMDQFESGVVGEAFGTLPERWQAVLWYTEVDGLKPAEIATLLGLSANGVSALAMRAREGLRQAYLQGHVKASSNDDRCQTYSSQLGAYVRGGLGARNKAKVEEHLNECAKCTAVLVQVNDVGQSMRGIIAPLFLGAIPMLGLPVVVASATAGTLGVATAANSPAGAGPVAGGSAPGSTPGARLGAALGAHVIAIAAIAVAAAAVVAGVAIGINESDTRAEANAGKGSAYLTSPPNEPAGDGDVDAPVKQLIPRPAPPADPVAPEPEQAVETDLGRQANQPASRPSRRGMVLLLPRGREPESDALAGVLVGGPDTAIDDSDAPSLDVTGPAPTSTPTEPTVAPTPPEPTVAPTEPTPSEPTPSEPTVDPTPSEPTVDPTEPTVDPTPTAPTVDPTPSEPTVDPTDSPATTKYINVEAIDGGYEVLVDASAFGSATAVRISFERLSGDGVFEVHRATRAGCSPATEVPGSFTFSCSSSGAGQSIFSVTGSPPPEGTLVVRVRMVDKFGNQTHADLVFG